jgi:hypothetical protein
MSIVKKRLRGIERPRKKHFKSSSEKGREESSKDRKVSQQEGGQGRDGDVLI